MAQHNTLDPGKLNGTLALPFQLRLEDFSGAVQDVYDFFRDVSRAARSTRTVHANNGCASSSTRRTTPQSRRDIGGR